LRRLGRRRCAPARRAAGAPGGVDGAAGDEEALAELAQLKRAASKGDAGAAAALARTQEVAARADAAFDVAEEDRNVFLMGSVLPAPHRPAPPRPAPPRRACAERRGAPGRVAFEFGLGVIAIGLGYLLGVSVLGAGSVLRPHEA